MGMREPNGGLQLSGAVATRERAGRASLPLLLALLGLLWTCVSACSDAIGDGPEETLSHFLDLMDRSRSDSRALKDAYALLDQDTQAGLRMRSTRARTLAGRDFMPWQMIAQGRFRLRFAPAPGGMDAQIDGDRATVVVSSSKSGSKGPERVEVPMVRQQGRWRVVLHLPPPEAQRQRTGDTVPTEVK